MPDLMEGQSRHRECAQETQTKRLVETRRLQDATVDHSPVREPLMTSEQNPMNVETLGGTMAKTRSVRKGTL